jgi:hypothetical protein
MEGSKWVYVFQPFSFQHFFAPLGPFQFYTRNWKGPSGFTFFSHSASSIFCPTWTLPISGVKMEGSKWGKKCWKLVSGKNYVNDHMYVVNLDKMHFVYDLLVFLQETFDFR